jgi:hypothetical protein
VAAQSPLTRRAAWRAPGARALFAALMFIVLTGLGGCTGSSAISRLPADWPARVELSATPFFPQTEHQCGPAALATVLGAAGRTVEPSALTAEVFLPGREGSLQAELVAAARARGLLPVATGTALDDVLAETAAGRPVLVLQQLGIGPWPYWHYAVVIGYDEPRQRVLLRSGTDERLEQRAAVFAATWARGGHWALVLLEPGQLPARPDLDRYMRAAADMERQSATAAEAAYRAAAARWPDAPLPALGLGNVAAARSDWIEAEHWYRLALQANPTTAAALNNRAEALGRLGCNALARRVLQGGMADIAAGDILRPALDETARALAAAATAADPARCSEFTIR